MGFGAAFIRSQTQLLTQGAKGTSAKTSQDSAQGQSNTQGQGIFAEFLKFEQILLPAKKMNAAFPTVDAKHKTSTTKDMSNPETLQIVLQSLQASILQLQHVMQANQSLPRVLDQQQKKAADQLLTDIESFLGQIKANAAGLGVQNDAIKTNPLFDSLQTQWQTVKQDLQSLAKFPALDPRISKILDSVRNFQLLQTASQKPSGVSLQNPLMASQIHTSPAADQAVVDAMTHNSSAKAEPVKKNALMQQDAGNVLQGMAGSSVSSHTVNVNVPEKVPVARFSTAFQQMLDQSMHQAGTGIMQDQNGTTQFRMKLVPEGLGEVHVVITSDNSQVSVQLTTATDQARQLLEAQTQNLRDILSAKGLTCDSVQVTTGVPDLSFAFSQSGDQSNKQWSERSSKNAKALGNIADIQADEEGNSAVWQKSMPESVRLDSRDYQPKYTPEFDATA
ncbi:flagellar hook-length control protein FliK [Fodinisporobacter ferrooxydans]|uniref:Flagellar hook-length control protein FliK n=1 Tax=Fodinisporobacter ferrooxydans TaxID=2901836 RepID=A0ABY4CFU5_9BACL|nr:flagellar hook-length control protein FliK [Alicyclobacillaceae bacterium MYW30-H2]